MEGSNVRTEDALLLSAPAGGALPRDAIEDDGWHQPQPRALGPETPCEGRVVIKVDPSDPLPAAGYISDGPGYYSERLHCSWLVEGPPGTRVSLSFIEFDTECGWDFVTVYDGAKRDPERRLAAASGIFDTLEGSQHSEHPVLVSSAHTMLVHFSSDQAWILEGFVLRWEVTACPLNCSGHGLCGAANVTTTTTNTTTNTTACACAPGWTGEACQVEVCPSNGTCSGRGVCNPEAGACVCDPGWVGTDCATPERAGQWSALAVDTAAAVGGVCLARAAGAWVAATGPTRAGMVYLYGGFRLNGGAWSNSLHAFDVATASWRLLPGGAANGTGAVPVPTSLHAVIMDAARDRLVVFGGETGRSSYTDALAVYSLADSEWVGVTTASSVGGAPWPAARAGHTLTLVDADTAILYGGFDNNHFDDTWVLDLDTLTWTEAAVTGTPPGDRWGHSAAAVVHPPSVGADTTASVFVFGGNQHRTLYLADLYVLRYPAMHWSELEPAGVDPAARFMHSAAVVGNLVFVHGGRVVNECYGDTVWVYDVDCNAWIDYGLSSASPAVGPQLHGRYGGGLVSVAVADLVRPCEAGGEGNATTAPCAALPANTTAADTWLVHFGGFASVMYGDVHVMPVVDCAGRGLVGDDCPHPTAPACPGPCEDHDTCTACVHDPVCGYCHSSESCLELGVGPGSCDVGTEPSAWAVSACAPGCSLQGSCGDCLAAGGECAWCDQTRSCYNATSEAAEVSECNAGGTLYDDACPVRCLDHLSCATCTDAGDGCAWCPYERICASPLTLCAPKISTCPTPCEDLPSCGSCLGQEPYTCMWCEATGACFDSREYVMSNPWGGCWDWRFGPSDCRAPCSEATTCGSCHEDPRCGWCAATQTCAQGDRDGPGFDEPSCPETGWDYDTCPCGDHEDCDACAGDPACGWCVESGVCARAFNGSLVEACQGDLADVDSCPDCGAHAACGECAADPSCGWCAKTQTCQRGSVERPATCPADWEFDTCVSCDHLANCSACVADEACGWCFVEGVCARGDAEGLYTNDPSDDGCVFDYGVCSPHCELHSECGVCGADPACGWCCDAYKGELGCTEWGDCPGTFRHTGCPDCDALGDCGACTADECCAWCAEDGGGGACSGLGAGVEYPDVAPAANCSVADWYAPFHAEACPMPCDAIDSCTPCAAQRACGWCAETETCLEVDGQANATTATCAFFYADSCPVDCSVLTSTNCEICTSFSECVFCEDVATASGAGVCTNEHIAASDPASPCHPVSLDPSRARPWQGACPVREGCPELSTRGCEVCLSTDGCAWCDSPELAVADRTCVYADLAALNPDAHCPAMEIFNATCPPSCAGSACATCEAQAGCVWCGEAATCVWEDGPSADCEGAGATCEDYCAAYATCDACGGDDNCGWCGVLEECGPATAPFDRCQSYVSAGSACPNIVRMSRGVVYEGVVASGLGLLDYSPRFYSIAGEDLLPSVLVFLDVQLGDADLYLSLTSTTPEPGNTMWSSTGPGDDTLWLDFSAVGEPGTLYVGVVGFSVESATYKLSFSGGVGSVVDNTLVSPFVSVFWIGCGLVICTVLLVVVVIRKFQTGPRAPAYMYIEEGAGVEAPFVSVVVRNDQPTPFRAGTGSAGDSSLSGLFTSFVAASGWSSSTASSDYDGTSSATRTASSGSGGSSASSSFAFASGSFSGSGQGRGRRRRSTAGHDINTIPLVRRRRADSNATASTDTATEATTATNTSWTSGRRRMEDQLAELGGDDGKPGILFFPVEELGEDVPIVVLEFPTPGGVSRGQRAAAAVARTDVERAHVPISVGIGVVLAGDDDGADGGPTRPSYGSLSVPAVYSTALRRERQRGRGGGGSGGRTSGSSATATGSTSSRTSTSSSSTTFSV